MKTNKRFIEINQRYNRVYKTLFYRLVVTQLRDEITRLTVKLEALTKGSPEYKLIHKNANDLLAHQLTMEKQWENNY